MSLIRWDPYRQMRSFRNAMDRFFEESIRRMRGEEQEMEAGLYIPVDVFESGDHLVITAVAPGAKPEDLDVSVSGNTLTVRGEIKQDPESEGKDVYFQERMYGPFSRSITLSSEYDLDKVEATCSTASSVLPFPSRRKPSPSRSRSRRGRPDCGPLRPVANGGAVMSLIRWDPYREMLSLRDTMNRLFEETLAPSWEAARRSAR
jgi:HSP20 family protein